MALAKCKCIVVKPAAKGLLASSSSSSHAGRHRPLPYRAPAGRWLRLFLAATAVAFVDGKAGRERERRKADAVRNFCQKTFFRRPSLAS